MWYHCVLHVLAVVLLHADFSLGSYSSHSYRSYGKRRSTNKGSLRTSSSTDTRPSSSSSSTSGRLRSGGSRSSGSTSSSVWSTSSGELSPTSTNIPRSRTYKAEGCPFLYGTIIDHPQSDTTGYLDISWKVIRPNYYGGRNIQQDVTLENVKYSDAKVSVLSGRSYKFLDVHLTDEQHKRVLSYGLFKWDFEGANIFSRRLAEPSVKSHIIYNPTSFGERSCKFREDSK